MTEKKIIVDYYFDYCCPWTYLSFKRLIQTTTRTASVINWKPILIADIEKEISQKNESRTLHPSEIKYKKKDLQDWANYCGLKIIARTNVPKETSTKALCGAFFAVEANKIAEYSALVFDAYFADLKDIANNDILIEIATKIELDLNGFQSAIDSVQNIDQLKENTSELLEKGGFGSPTMFVGDDMYFGNDRMPLVEFSIGGASGKILVLPGQHGT
jgi:2-hydroxychromene-2-carboxylate isomerase